MTSSSPDGLQRARVAAPMFGLARASDVGARILAGSLLALSLACATDRTAERRPISQLGDTSEPSSSGEAMVRRPPPATPAVFAPSSQDGIDAAKRLSSTVLALGRANGSPAREVASALEALSGAIRVMAVRRPVVEGPLTRIDRDAVLLQNADELDPGAPRWAADGLLASLDAIEDLGAGTHVHPWTDDARAAALAIDEGLMLTFQRGILQEAFRSTADALMVVVQSERCDGRAVVAQTAVPAFR